jgi:hypothetical protein
MLGKSPWVSLAFSLSYGGKIYNRSYSDIYGVYQWKLRVVMQSILLRFYDASVIYHILLRCYLDQCYEELYIYDVCTGTGVPVVIVVAGRPENHPQQACCLLL